MSKMSERQHILQYTRIGMFEPDDGDEDNTEKLI